MAESNSFGKKIEDELQKFRVEVSLVIVGLFLALGFQSIIQFVELLIPHITPYFFLALGIGSLVMVLVFLNFAAHFAGIDQVARKSRKSGDT
jgi:hypothetical protein